MRFDRRLIFLLAMSLSALVPATVLAQAGSESGNTDRAAQMGACADACLSRIRSGESTDLGSCIMIEGVPECHGLVPYAYRIWTSVCEAASRLQNQCEAGPPASILESRPASPTGVSPAHSETGSGDSDDSDHRPQRLVLECRHADGSTFEPLHEGHSSWYDRCECGDGFAGVSASRYVMPLAERRRLRRAEARGEVHRIVQCLPRGASTTQIDATRSALDSDLVQRVSDLEGWRSQAEPQLEDHEGRITALEQREPASSDDGVSEQNNAERDAALSQRIDALTHTTGRAVQRLWRRSTAPGNVGLRIEPFFLVGFTQLSVQNGSHVPFVLGGELDLTVSLGHDWFVEAGLGMGYAFRDVALPDALQGVYHAGFFAIIERVFSIGFGAMLTERYGEIPSHAFVSNHTVIAGYLEAFGVIDLGEGWAFTPGARVFGGPGLRFDHVSDAVSPDGGLMLMLGFSYFGGGSNASEEPAPVISDDPEEGRRAHRDLQRDAESSMSPASLCNTPYCRDTAVGRVQVP